ncbi:putative mitogen-activated protein kinase [Leishmania major strain Friedlin]|uniref:Putative mitogen-activated protein kinase n=1 Tax=Leishmania major TaxID=5664 RepID=Q4Q701_LEIMA|nr:putative mitogen-activated protein kinase [Leishmania major strain Friedlin]CAG9578528.1 mitogen-activated_protein_kinase_5/MPK5 [Leishmania major strain Friedlin]CAJ06664.1 putative mitogen-activated protein kinase [Leishmania major strain Friedlin]|eukprot:XP_001684897.1 putative mitogen-activated protein kinase [Leishmania major strain Friedlin]
MASNAAANGSFGSSANAVQLVSTQRGRKVYCVRGQSFDIDDNYTVTSVIGHGAYGVVCAALDDRTFQEVAIKRVSRVFEDLIDGRRIWREILLLRILKECGCRNVLRLIRVLPPRDPIMEFRDLYLVTDLYDIDLFSIIRQNKCESIDLLRRISVRVLRCLADMHSMGIVHRDIKPSNILLRDEKNAEEVIVCDFGLARAGLHRLSEPLDLTDYVVTRWYRPPELLLMCPYSYPIDIWAVGCVMAEYAMQRPLFAGRDYIHQLQFVLSSIPITGVDFIERSSSSSGLANMNEIAKKYKGTRPLPQLLSKLPRDGLELVTEMLAFEPNKRITAQEALKHPFFSSVGGPDCKSYPAPPELDLGFDMHAEVSECQLRRAIWDELQYYRKQ